MCFTFQSLPKPQIVIYSRISSAHALFIVYFHHAPLTLKVISFCYDAHAKWSKDISRWLRSFPQVIIVYDKSCYKMVPMHFSSYTFNIWENGGLTFAHRVSWIQFNTLVWGLLCSHNYIMGISLTSTITSFQFWCMENLHVSLHVMLLAWLLPISHGSWGHCDRWVSFPKHLSVDSCLWLPIAYGTLKLPVWQQPQSCKQIALVPKWRYLWPAHT